MAVPPPIHRFESDGEHDCSGSCHIHERFIPSRHYRVARSHDGECRTRGRARVRENLPYHGYSSPPRDEHSNHERHQKRSLPRRRHDNVDDGVRNYRRNQRPCPGEHYSEPDRERKEARDHAGAVSVRYQILGVRECEKASGSNDRRPVSPVLG